MSAKKREAATRPKQQDEGRWGFFAGIKLLLSAFPRATTGEKSAILAMSFGAVMFIGLGLVGSVALPGWAVLLMFLLAVVLIFATAGGLLFIERGAALVALDCRQVPIYPPADEALQKIRAALQEIREDASNLIRSKATDARDEDIRGNIFLLAKVQGGPAHGTWKLVIHPSLCANMDYLPERQLQFSIGQGATGVTFRDGIYQISRRQTSPKGNWERKFQMTAELEAQVHPKLKWIVTFPLLRRNTSEAVGVLNIDGLADVPDDDLLNHMASSIRNKSEDIANYLVLQPSTCIAVDQLGVIKHA